MKKIKKLLIWIIVLAMIAVAVAAGVWYSSNAAVDVKTSQVTQGEIRQVIEETAVVKGNSTATVYAEGAGRVLEVRSEVGNQVKKGDVLAVLDKGDLELSLRDAQAKIAAVRAQLAGTDIVEFADKIEQARISQGKAQDALDTATRDYENVKKLFEAAAVSKDDLDKAEVAMKMAQNSYNAAKVALNEVSKGTPGYVRDAYRAQLEQALVLKDTIDRSIAKQQIVATQDGILLSKDIEANSVITAGTKAFVIGDVSALKLEADILADDVVRMQVGNDVEIYGKTTLDKTLMGKVVKIDPYAREITSALGVSQRRVKVEISLMDASGTLKPGYNCEIRVITKVDSQALIVPDTALFDYQGSPCVFKVKDNITVMVKVKKGIESLNKVEILEGIQQGDVIITKPDNSIKEGQKVNSIGG